ncbi:MAG: tetratricopeptide repeat protein [Pirellulaceae bacterium]|nr:tetratricopeptide repeat protein [Pirellulaceae bacterium]
MPSEEELLSAAIQCQHSGDLANAIEFYRHVLMLNPQQADARNNLGNVYRAMGNTQQAEQAYRQAIALRPDFSEAFCNLGLVLQDQQQFESAEQAYLRSIELRPDLAATYHNLGMLYQGLQQTELAVNAYGTAIQRGLSHPDTYHWYGKTLMELGKVEQAKFAFKKAVELRPEYVEALTNLGNAHIELGEFGLGIEAYQRAIKLSPELYDAYHNLGNAYVATGRPEEALDAFEIAVKLSPDAAASLSMLVHLQQECCQWDGSFEACTRVLELVEKSHSANAAQAINPMLFFGLSIPTTAEQQLRCSKNWVQQMCVPPVSAIGESALRNRTIPQAGSLRHKDHRIRVGYMSADFREHPVSILIAELFEEHDRERFEVYVYSTGHDDGSAIRQRIVIGCNYFRNVASASIVELAEQISADGIDILVDLQGHTQSARTKVLAMRPAPIQVNYLGFPGTMGAEFIDYALVDDYVVPPEQQRFFMERLMYLPGCFMVNDSRREISLIPTSRTAYGLPEKAFVFCAFHSNYKLTPEMFQAWMRILQAVPESVLWLRAGNPTATANLIHRGESMGVSRSRLIFAEAVSMPEHLARHRCADIFLDTYPYNQHSTASDALRMGLPLVTLSGTTFASRVAGSLLRAIGLSELITNSLAEYESLAVSLATQPDRITAVRQKLESQLATSDLYDGRAFARKIEEAFDKMLAERRHDRSLGMV